MIRHLGKLLLALCLLTVGGGIVANAQINSDVTIHVNVPFNYTVGDTTLPAGKYEIRTTEDLPNVLDIRSTDGRTSVLVDTENVEAKDRRPVNKSEAIFEKIGDNYFLSEIWVAGSGSGSELTKSKREKSLQARGMNSERHSVAAVLKH
jgi:hypothetical protein